MSELGEYWHEVREKEQIKKIRQLNWNTDVIDGLSVEYGFRVVKHTEVHFSLFHKDKGRMDYWPSTSKGL